MPSPEKNFGSIDPKKEIAANQLNQNQSNFSPQAEALQYEKEALKCQTQLNTQQMELGLIGKLLGSGENAKMSIVTIVILLNSLAIIGVLFSENIKDASTLQIITILMNVVSVSIGYIFGQKSK